MPPLCQCVRKECQLTQNIVILCRDIPPLETLNMCSHRNNKCILLEYFKHIKAPEGQPWPWKLELIALQSIQEMDTFFYSRNRVSLNQFLYPGPWSPQSTSRNFAFNVSLLKSVGLVLSKKFLALRNFQKPTCEYFNDCQHTFPIRQNHGGHFMYWNQGCLLSKE